MMETFIVLGLCFILYEALDFFQGCMHSTAPSANDQIEAYRRQLDEQRQQQQQEFILANFTPLLGTIHLSSSQSLNSTTPTASTASVISDLRDQHLLRDREQIAASTPALNNTNAGFRPATKSFYESPELHGTTSSLPRDYYYVQQQQLKNKTSTKSLISKFSSNSDNRIFPESGSAVLGLPSGVITTQPTFIGNSFDCQPPVVPPSPLLLDLKRAILTSHNNNNIQSSNTTTLSSFQPKSRDSLATLSKDYTLRTSFNTEVEPSQSEECEEEEGESDCEECLSSSSSGSGSSSSESSASESESVSAASATLASVAYTSDQEAADEKEFERSVSLSSSHADFREIECERLRRKCVSVKRIYSISEKF